MKKLTPSQKKAVMKVIAATRGMGGARAGAPGGAPQMGGMMPPPAPGGMPLAPMKKGGAVKEKWVPPWAKKKEGGKKFAKGGSVVCSAGGRVGGKGDGIAQRGRTRGIIF